MAVKIRLQRHGKKGKPFYHIVVADSRAPRDGKFIERLGSYNPTTNPATIDIDREKSVEWLDKGAQPTDTTRAILSYTGVLYKKHLLGGVKKGALTAEQADTKFAEWQASKEAKVNSKISGIDLAKAEQAKARLAAEEKIKAEKAKAIEAKNAALAQEVEETAPAEAETEVSAEAEATETETTPTAEIAAESAETSEAEPEASSEESTSEENSSEESSEDESSREPKAE